MILLLRSIHLAWISLISSNLFLYHKLTQITANLECVDDRSDMGWILRLFNQNFIVPSCKNRSAEFRLLDCDINDLRNPIAGACYGPNFAGNSNFEVFLFFFYKKHMAKFIDCLPQILTMYERFVGHGQRLMGEKANCREICFSLFPHFHPYEAFV